MSGGLRPWLRTLASGGIAAAGLAVLWSSWPDDAFRGEEALPSDPWTVTAHAGWRAELPEPPPEDFDRSFAEDRDSGPVDARGEGANQQVPEGFFLYTVVKNDSLWRIAERELGSARRLPEIEHHNPGIGRRPILPGMQLLLPGAGASAAAPSSRDPAAPVAPGKVRRHAVGKGETLSRIGERYGVSADAIFAANRDQLRSKDKVRAGQKLRIPPAEGGVR